MTGTKKKCKFRGKNGIVPPFCDLYQIGSQGTKNNNNNKNPGEAYPPEPPKVVLCSLFETPFSKVCLLV